MVIYKLLCWLSCHLLTPLCSAGASAPRWTLSLRDYVSPSLGSVLAELSPAPFHFVNQHTHQAHLARSSSCYTSTWTLLRPCTALPAGERQHVSNVVQICPQFTHVPGLNPHCQQAFPWRTFHGLPREIAEKVHKNSYICCHNNGTV